MLSLEHYHDSNNGGVCIDKRNIEMFWDQMKALIAKLHRVIGTIVKGANMNGNELHFFDHPSTVIRLVNILYINFKKSSRELSFF
jgi:hypothetical protein